MKPIFFSLATALILVAGCAQVRLAPRYLARCPAEGPEATSDLGIRRVPLELRDFYSAIRTRIAAFEIGELGVVSEAGVDYPILSIRRRAYRPKYARDSANQIATP